MTNSFMGIYEFSSQNIELFNKIIKPLVETHTGLAYVDAMSYYGHGSVKMGYIEKLIEEANLVIVDLSIKNTNVFLEYGIAWALKKKIVLQALLEIPKPCIKFLISCKGFLKQQLMFLSPANPAQEKSLSPKGFITMARSKTGLL